MHRFPKGYKSNLSMGSNTTGSSSRQQERGSSNRRSWLSQSWLNAGRKKPLNSLNHVIIHRDDNSNPLSRRLSVFDLLLLGIGGSIGAGIFVVTGTVAHDAGPGVAISFSLAGLASALIALCYAELAARFPPVVGGAYLYAYSAFNELTAFLVFGQLMFDYHISAASIARSLAGYVVSLFELIPSLKGQFPQWMSHGQELLGGAISINILAPILLFLITFILCMGIKESSAVNSLMTITKVTIVVVVIVVGSFEVDVSNWSPVTPNGFQAVMTGATVVFFSYVGFDSVANCAEESAHPQRDLPVGIIGSLSVCVVLYIGVCLVITGMIPYYQLSDEAPLAEAFTSMGLKYVSVLICVGAVVGLFTTILVGLYVQSRLYLGIGRDGLLPAFFARVHPTRHTPVNSQIFVGCIAGTLSAFFNVSTLSRLLSVGSLAGYSVVSACVVSLRWKVNSKRRDLEGPLLLLTVAVCGFGSGICYRYSAGSRYVVATVITGGVAVVALNRRHEYDAPPGFACPWVPTVPAISIFFNIFLFAQLHYEAWIRFVVVAVILVGMYLVYGQYNAKAGKNDEFVYHEAPSEVN